MRQLEGIFKKIVSVLSVLLIGFQIYTAGVGVLPDLIQRSVHLGFVLVLCFLLKPAIKNGDKKKVPIYDMIFALLSACSSIYIVMNADKVLWDPLSWISPLDNFFAIVTIILVLEVSRRCVGIMFPSMAIFFMIYAYFGPYFPGMWGHRQISVDSMAQFIYHSTNGLWGTLVGISATMLAMFAIFSAVLSITGGAKTFIKIGQRLTGESVGGQGKVALVASSLFGMISGSAMGNVVATGTFTIPLMKEAKYSNEWAATISAVGSTGGQIMPPIMGAGAFIMAQLLGVSYFIIAKAAIVPAFLYYLGSFVAVHYVSRKNNIKGTSDNKEPVSFVEYAIIFIPIAVFIALLFRGFTVTIGAYWASVFGISTYFVFLFLKKLDYKLDKDNEKRDNGVVKVGRTLYNVSLDASKSIIGMAGLMGGAQIVITLINMTGFGVKLTDLIISIGQGNLFACLVLSMFVCIILGMGLPTTAAYVLSAAILAPALMSLGLEPLISHLFVFYFATLATITPPVCAAVFMSSGIAKSNWLETGGLSVLIALPAFIVPYTFAYDQSYLLIGSVANIVVSLVLASLGVFCIALSVAGHFKMDFSTITRGALMIFGIVNIVPNMMIRMIGCMVCIAILVKNYKDSKKKSGDLDVVVEG